LDYKSESLILEAVRTFARLGKIDKARGLAKEQKSGIDWRVKTFLALAEITELFEDYRSVRQAISELCGCGSSLYAFRGWIDLARITEDIADFKKALGLVQSGRHFTTEERLERLFKVLEVVDEPPLGTSF